MDLKGYTHDMIIMTQNVQALLEGLGEAYTAQGGPMEH
jgi:hypothetical protein